MVSISEATFVKKDGLICAPKFLFPRFKDAFFACQVDDHCKTVTKLQCNNNASSSNHYLCYSDSKLVIHPSGCIWEKVVLDGNTYYIFIINLRHRAYY